MSSKFLKIYGWDYLFEFKSNMFNVTHNVTPKDGGYGRDIHATFPNDYFKKKTIPELYEEIGNYMIKPSSKFFDKEKEIKELYS